MCIFNAEHFEHMDCDKYAKYIYLMFTNLNIFIILTMLNMFSKLNICILFTTLNIFIMFSKLNIFIIFQGCTSICLLCLVS